MISDQQARDICERYFAAQTSLEEEEALRQYLKTPQADEDLKLLAPLLLHWQDDKPTAVIRPLVKRLAAVVAAAGIILLWIIPHDVSPPSLQTGFPMAENHAVDWSKYEVTDEDEALLVIKNALHTAGSHINDGPRRTFLQIKQIEAILE